MKNTVLYSLVASVVLAWILITQTGAGLTISSRPAEALMRKNPILSSGFGFDPGTSCGNPSCLPLQCADPAGTVCPPKDQCEGRDTCNLTISHRVDGTTTYGCSTSGACGTDDGDGDGIGHIIY